MKPGLRRIEATLNQLNTQRAQRATSFDPTPPNSPSFSLKVLPGSQRRDVMRSEHATFPPALKVLPKALTAPKTTAPGDTVQPFPVQTELSSPNLPKFKLPNFSNHRHAANPGLAMGLLKEIEGTVAQWQDELQRLLLQIQELYLEGPIVDGWLESYASNASVSEVKVLRHADVDQLMEYVQEICDHPQADAATATPSATGYKLCGLDADGQLWSRPCPPDQIPYVSLAIARYQKLRQMLGRKQHLENRLNQLAQALVALHGHLQEPQKPQTP